MKASDRSKRQCSLFWLCNIKFAQYFLFIYLSTQIVVFQQNGSTCVNVCVDEQYVFFTYIRHFYGSQILRINVVYNLQYRGILYRDIPTISGC